MATGEKFETLKGCDFGAADSGRIGFRLRTGLGDDGVHFGEEGVELVVHVLRTHARRGGREGGAGECLGAGGFESGVAGEAVLQPAQRFSEGLVSAKAEYNCCVSDDVQEASSCRSGASIVFCIDSISGRIS